MKNPLEMSELRVLEEREEFKRAYRLNPYMALVEHLTNRLFENVRQPDGFHPTMRIREDVLKMLMEVERTFNVRDYRKEAEKQMLLWQREEQDRR